MLIVAQILHMFVQVYLVMVFLRCILPPQDFWRFEPLKLVFQATEPVIVPFRRIIPFGFRRDPSPWLSLIVLLIVRAFLFNLLVPGGMFSSRSTWALKIVRNTWVSAPFQSLASFVDMVLLVGVFVIFALYLLQQSFNPIVRVMTDAIEPVRRPARRVSTRRWAVLALSLVTLWAGYLVIAELLLQTGLLAGGLPFTAWLAPVFGALMLTVYALNGFIIVIFLGVILSWFEANPLNPAVQTVEGIYQPLLRPFRGLIPMLGPLDLSPILAIVAYQLAIGLLQKGIVAAFKAVYGPLG